MCTLKKWSGLYANTCDWGCFPTARTAGMRSRMHVHSLFKPERCLGSLLGSLYSILYFTYFTQTAARGPTRNTCTFSFTLWTFYCFDRSLGWPHFYHFSPNILNVYTTPTLWFSSQHTSVFTARSGVHQAVHQVFVHHAPGQHVRIHMAHPTAPYRVHRVQHATCTAVNLIVSHRFLVLERRMIDL